MLPRISERKFTDRKSRAGALALVALAHLALIWALINLAIPPSIPRNFTTAVNIILPEKIPPKMGAQLKSPVINPSPFVLPHIALPKVVVEIIHPTPDAPPAPAPAAETGASAPTQGDRTPLPPDDFSAYVKLIHNQMQATLNQISSERASQLYGNVVVEIEVDRHGNILAAAMLGDKHPGWMTYEVNQMVQRSNPLPPFPATIRAAKAAFAMPVNFTESGPGFGP